MENTLLSSRQGAGERVRRTPGHRAGPGARAAVGVLTAVVAARYSAFALAQYYTYRDTSYDLVIFDEAVRSYSHYEPGTSIIKGLHNGFGPNFSVLGDHWSPILASLAPLYWIYDSPKTLLAAQAVLLALAIPPLWLFTRRDRDLPRGGAPAGGAQAAGGHRGPGRGGPGRHVALDPALWRAAGWTYRVPGRHDQAP